MAEEKPKRRWFRFSLRTLFVLLTIFAFPMAWLGWQASIVQQRQAMRKWIESKSDSSTKPFNTVVNGTNIMMYFDEYLPQTKGLFTSVVQNRIGRQA